MRDTEEQETSPSFGGQVANLGNELGFALRKALYSFLSSPISGSYQEKAEDKTCLNADGERLKELPWLKAPYALTTDLQKKQARYRSQYPLDSLYQRGTRLRWLENITVLDCLERFMEASSFIPPKPTLAWLDVGSKNWAYVDALWAFLIQQTGQNDSPTDIILEGIELDPYRRYVDGFHRMDYAKTYTRQLPQTPHCDVRYHAGDIHDWQGVSNMPERRYDVISWFLPFVFEDPHMSWGLPKRYFDPVSTLRHTVNLLENGGSLLLVNQGEAEYREQLRLLDELQTDLDAANDSHYGLEIRKIGPLPVSFLPFQHTRYGILCRKLPTGNH